MEWEKIIGGKWSFFTFSILADIHGRVFKNIFDQGPEPVLFTVQNGFSSFYYTKNGLEKFRIKLANIVKEDENIPKMMYDECLYVADKIRDLFNNSKFEKEDMKKFIGLLYEFVPSYVFLKQAFEKLEKNETFLFYGEDSRKKTELLWYDFEEFVTNFIKKTGIENLNFCTFGEMEDFIENNNVPNNLDKRKKCLMIQDYNKKIIRSGSEVDKFEKSFYKSLNILKGEIAYPGNVEGIARIILDPKHVKRFDKGDILITQMTRPDFEFLMAKSGAIVTDAGGILCHAAIISREMKIPCLLSTNIATKFFKDGDLIKIVGNKVMKVERN